jgi:hypothetical protein
MKKDPPSVQRLINAASNGNGLVLNKDAVIELAMAMNNMAEDLGKLMFLSDYFEKRYLKYRDEFGPHPDDFREDYEQEGQETEVNEDDPSGEAEGEMDLFETEG